jgi:hypothetical protein
MKRFIGIVLFISVLMTACNKNKTVDEKDNDNKLTETNSQENTNQNINKTMYVNAADGLWVKNSPSSDGEIFGVLYYLTEVTVTKEDDNTIGGVDEKWVYITRPFNGWVFNGFLEDFDQHKKRIETDQLEEELIGARDIIDRITGYWRVIDDKDYDDMICFFIEDKDGSKRWGYGRYGTDVENAGLGATWKVVNKDTIELKFPIEEGVYATRLMSRIKFIDNNMLTFNSDFSGFQTFQTMKKLWW